jgi:HKD family nuclease
MAKKALILQGFTTSTHIDAMRRLFELPEIQKVLMSVAFITEDGVEKIEPQLMAHASLVTVFAGIRNDTTSYQALVRLHGVVSNLYTVDTGTRTVIFHPKLYLVRGRDRAQLIVGSANLTLAGLNNNIEAGMLLDFDLMDADDRALIEEIEMQFDMSSTDYPDNIVKVSKIADLDELLATGRLVDEMDIPPPDILRWSDADNSRTGDDGKDDRRIANHSGAVPRIKLKVKSLHSGVAKAKAMPKEPNAYKASAESLPAAGATLFTSGGEPSSERTARSIFHKRHKKGPRVRAREARQEAIALGKKWYFTGEPCIYGHVKDRLVSNGKCRECNRQDSERANRLGLYR